MMRKKIGSNELLAILAVAGIASTTGASAATSDNNSATKTNTMAVVDHHATARSSGKEAGCGKCGANSCGAKYYMKKDPPKKRHHTAQLKRLRATTTKTVTKDSK